MPRFSLRDLFWLTLVVGMGVALLLESRQEARVHKAMEDAKQTVVTRDLQFEKLAAKLRERGISIEFYGQGAGSFVLLDKEPLD